VPVLAADVVVVLLFALVGRVSHAEGDLVTGTLTTASPFVIGLLAGWVAGSCAGQPPASQARTVRFGWWLLAWTIGGGLLLRALLGEGLAPAFVLVATCVLALGLVVRRWVAGRWADVVGRHQRATSPSAADSEARGTPR
jgi:hypothetical protein